MIAGDDAGYRQAWAVTVEDGELDTQTLRQVARADANRIETLDCTQHGDQLRIVDTRLGLKGGPDIFERTAQVAVVGDRLDQRRADAPIALGEVAQV